MTWILAFLMLVGLLFPMIGCEQKREAGVFPHVATQAYRDNPCTDTVGLAVLNKLWGAYPQIRKDASKEELDRIKAGIACTREWNKTVTDKEQQESFTCWLDHDERELNGAYNDLASGKNAQKDEYERDRNERMARVREYEKAHPVPAPQCADKKP